VPTRSDRPRALIRYAFACAAVTVALAWIIFLARDALLLIYISALIAIGISPLVNTIQRDRLPIGQGKIPRWAAILVIYLLLIAVIVLIGMVIIPPLVTQARELWSRAPDLLHRAQLWLIQRRILTSEISVREAVQESSVDGTDAVGAIIAAIWGVVGGVFGLITLLILAFYLLVESESIVTAFVRMFPRGERARVETVCRRIVMKVSAWLGGHLLLGGMIGATAALGLFLMGVPYFYVLALVAGIGEMIPIVGPILSAIPAMAVALSVSPALALGVALFFFLQQQLENHVLVPRLMGRQVGISPVVVIVALLIGGSVLGIIGAILAVPTAAILQVLVEELWSTEASSD
jgi:predicted PurR-regulated permease PerM